MSTTPAQHIPRYEITTPTTSTRRSGRNDPTPNPRGMPCRYLLPVDGRILEPSAGLGRLYRAIRDAGHAGSVVMVEQSPQCCRELYELTVEDQHATLKQGDFLTRTAADLGGFFDGVIMNPPFKQWRDIKHIRHARTLLGPAGRLVSICANGPRQRAALMDEATDWIDLPPGSFIEEGTHVNAAIVVVDA